MKPLSYTTVRTRRKTICLRVLEDGTLQVRAPLRASTKVIEGLVEQHASWIYGRQQAAAARNAGSSKSLAVTFGGTSFPLPQARREQPGPVMEAWLKGRAKAILNKRCAELAAKMGVCYRQVKVGHAASRWGSCSSKGNLNFSYRVMLLPKALADYVVVHELCHLRQMNHSPAFWALVKGQMPDYAARRQRLADLGNEIDFVHWSTVREE